MLMRQERIALLLLAGVAVAVIAGFVVMGIVGKHGFAHPYSEASADGELVRLGGNVGRVTLIENGGHISLVVCNVTVFIPASAAQGLVIHKNDSVIVYGIVQTYHGKKEIVITDPDDIAISTVP